MHFPKLVLIVRRFRSMRRHQRILVNLHQREMMKDDLHLVAVLLLDLFEFRIELAAWRTLVITVLFEHHRRTDFHARSGRTGGVSRLRLQLS